MALDSGGSPGNEYRLAYNYSGIYPGGECLHSYSLDASTGWVQTGFDLAFRTYMDYVIDENDAEKLDVKGVNGTLAGGQVNFDVYDFEYVGEDLVFRVNNRNTFAVTFDWTTRTYFMIFAESPTLDIGNDGTVDWSGVNVSTLEPLDITAPLNTILDKPSWPDIHVDRYGNELYRIVLNLSATTEGDVALRGFAVYYHGSINTSDVAVAINENKAGLVADAEGNVSVPVNITSDTEGELNVTAFHIEYDLPPYSGLIPDQTVLEDGPMVGGPLHLDSHIYDDFDNNNLEYTVVMVEGDANVSWNLTGESYLTFNASKDWHGVARFQIRAEDTSGLVYTTNVFNVTVESVNDPPSIVELGDQTPSFEVAHVVDLEVVDPDNTTDDFVLSTNSSYVTADSANLSLTFLYPRGSTAESVEVTISDGLNGTVYVINVTPVESNTPPVVDTIVLEVSLDAQGLFNLSPYVEDAETPDEDLIWEVIDFPQALVANLVNRSVLQIIPLATVADTYTVELNVSDPEGNVVTVQVTVVLSAAERHPPVIKRGEEGLQRLVTVYRGEELIINLALNDYWYDQEDYNMPEVMRWEVTSLRPKLFSVEIDQDQRLHITAKDTTGTGYFTIRLFDSDGDASTTIESVQVEVVERGEEKAAWTIYAIASLLLLLVVVLLAAASRRRGAAERPPAPMPKVPEPVEGVKETPAAKPTEVAPPPAKAAKPAPPEKVPARIEDALVIHESTSLITHKAQPGDHILSEEKSDELVELATLFAQERFEDVQVGGIKAFKFEDGTEVLVGKGKNYFLVTRCSGNQFDDVVEEMKRTIVDIDVELADLLTKWYPGQRVERLEEELKRLLEGG